MPGIEPAGLGLADRVAVVTGALGGIGWASARALARHGASVVLVARQEGEEIDERVAQLTAETGGDHLGVRCDVRRRDEIQSTVRAVFAKYKRLDILVNNAGVLDDALIGMMTDEAIANVFETNTFAPMHFMQAASRLMKRHGSGSIINVSSIVGRNGNAGQVNYAGSKAALIGMTYSAAKELAPEGIRVNAVAPGFIDTAMARQVPESVFSQRLDSIAMGRIGTPDDVANVILFLACDLSSYVTGQVLGVDGGMLI